MKLKDMAIICYTHSIHLSLRIKRKHNNKVIQTVLFLICLPYIVGKWLAETIYEYTFGIIIVSRRLKKEKLMHFEDELAFVAIVKNEATYIKEWIEFHKNVGVTRFYIYDNESTDNIKQVLKPYIESGEVVYCYYPGQAKQVDAYNDAIRKYGAITRYMGFIDIDEFVLPTDARKKLNQVVKEILMMKPNASGVGVDWYIYGSSGYIERPNGLIIENYLKRAADSAWQNRHIKTICNPRLVKDYISPHFPIYYLGAWSVNENGKRLHAWYNKDINYSKIRCNHYFCKSKEEFIKKQNRGLADRTTKYDMSKFDVYNLNDVYDDTMSRYINEVKMRLKADF
ncbi:MAG: glycosyltransferase family 92 protein [Clostridiaceae bacterium]